MKAHAYTALLVGLSALLAPAQGLSDKARLGPAVYHSDFRPNPGASADSGSRDGWESFPISQETGYDPTIQPETSHRISALVREMAPKQDGPFQLGFIRRMHLVAGSGASLKVRVRVPYITGPTKIEVSVFRGAKEEHHTAMVTGDGWQDASFPISVSSAWITAVAIAADYPHAVSGRAQRFLIEDVRLKALATRRLDMPQADFLWDPSRELFYHKKFLHPEEDLDVRAGNSKGVRWTLIAPDGKPAVRETGSNVHHHFSANAASGIWTLRIESSDAETTALLLVRPQHPSGLLFDQKPAISAQLLNSIRERRTLLEKTAYPAGGMNIDRFDSHWLLAGLPSYFNITLQSSELAMLAAMEYGATNDSAARDEARKLLESIAQWRMWVHPWFPAHGYHSYYPVGIMTKYVVMAEQFLGNDLSQEDRKQLDHDLMELSVKPIYEEYVQDDRLQFNTSNWIGNTVGGALLAALQSDDEYAAGYALGLYVKDSDHVEAAYMSDGCYGEGVTYQRFDLEMTSLVAEAAKRQLGTSLDKFLMSPERYMLYASYGKDGLMDYGDTHADITPSNVFAYQAAENKSASLTDFYLKYRDQGAAEILSRVLWESAIKSLDAQPTPEPASVLFGQRGIVVLRDSLDPNATVVAMRAGRNFNHNHADEGSIFFAHGGKLWLGEAGYADYYKDPSYATFNIQAIGHNALLVNGNGESQVLPGNAVFGTAPAFTHSLLGPQASLVQADLTAAYGGKVKRYTRSLFFQQGGPLVVIDDVTAAAPARFTQVWHPELPATLSGPSDNGFLLSDGQMEVDVRAFAVGALTTNRTTSPLPLVEYENAEHELIRPPMQFEISDTLPRVRETMVTLIEPHDNQRDERSPAKWETRSNSSTLNIDRAGVQIDNADSASVCRPIRAWWRNGEFVICGMQYEDHRLNAGISANHPIDLQLVREENAEIGVEIDATSPTALKFRNFRRSDSTRCSAPDVCSEDGMGAISIPAGHTSLHLRYQSTIYLKPVSR